jgi:hypothetical protein
LEEHETIGVRPEALIEWAEAGNCLEQPWVRWFAIMLPLPAVAAVTVWITTSSAIPTGLVFVSERSACYIGYALS